MPDLDFNIESADRALRRRPHDRFQAARHNIPPAQVIHTVVLRAQIQIESTRRHYTPPEQEKSGGPFRRSRPLEPHPQDHVVGLMPSWFSRYLPANPSWICPSLARLTSTWRPQSIFTRSKMETCPCFFCLAERSSTRTKAERCRWRRFLGQRSQVPVASANLARPDRKLLSEQRLVSLRKDVFDRLYQYKVRCGIPTWEQTSSACSIR